MSTEIIIATWIVRLMGVYLAFGVVFAIYFVTRGVGRVDPNAQHGTRGFRVLIFPGAAALWPILLRRLIKGSQEPPIERNSHRDRAKAMEQKVLR